MIDMSVTMRGPIGCFSVLFLFSGLKILWHVFADAESTFPSYLRYFPLFLVLGGYFVFTLLDRRETVRVHNWRFFFRFGRKKKRIFFLSLHARRILWSNFAITYAHTRVILTQVRYSTAPYKKTKIEATNYSFQKHSVPPINLCD